MVTATTNISDFRASLLERLSHTFAQWAEKRERYALYKQTVNELSELSDHELRDLGLSRFNIRSTAWEIAQR